MKGFLIDIEGLDGSGKETQAKLLFNYIKDNISQKARYISFPNYESKSSKFAKMYLDGEFGDDIFGINPYAVSSFFAVDRYFCYKNEWGKFYNEGYFIVANRYTSSNSIYQMPKFGKENWDKYLKWSYDYEYDRLGLPKPDVVIYLDVPVDVSQKLINDRCKRENCPKDLHEVNLNFLNLCHEAGEYVSKKEGWHTIECMNAGGLKSVEQIHGEIIKFLLMHMENK